MTNKLSTRVVRSYTFTFESEADKAAALAHAKKKGTNLANLLKMLLAADMASK